MITNIYELAIKTLPPEQIDNHGTDLYIMVTKESRKLIEQYKFKANVETFISAIPPHVLWYDIPFAYAPGWTKTETEGN
ncbi:MAG: hypothetical protein J6Y47_03260 [Bacteroidales bacterium]|nr:hypothetical protein [Bacteroidales bacterium]